MRTLRAFTLIELLIVVAIIAILAAIAVPNFLEAQVRSKVSRVRSDMRSLATGLESYYIDTNTYPAWRSVAAATLTSVVDGATVTAVPTAGLGSTFRLRNTTGLSTLTTPVAYLTSYPIDAFAEPKGLTFRYYASRSFWITWSPGPALDYTDAGDLNITSGTSGPFSPLTGLNNNGTDASGEFTWAAQTAGPETLYTPVGNPGGIGGVLTSLNLISYDPTNGTTSAGIVWRAKQ